MLRVEQLSLQLEDLRRGKLNGIQTTLGGQVTGAAALELRKLYQELQVRDQSFQIFFFFFLKNWRTFPDSRLVDVRIYEVF